MTLLSHTSSSVQANLWMKSQSGSSRATRRTDREAAQTGGPCTYLCACPCTYTVSCCLLRNRTGMDSKRRSSIPERETCCSNRYFEYTVCGPGVGMRTLVYVRISRDPEWTRTGVERQRSNCLSLVKDRGWTVLGVLEDNDRSAYRGKQRPGWNEAIDQIQSGSVPGNSSDARQSHYEPLSARCCRGPHKSTVFKTMVALVAGGCMRAMIKWSTAIPSLTA